MEQVSSEFACRMHLSKYSGSNPEVTIPEGVEVIDPRAFQGKELIKTVIFPASIKTVDWSAFEECKSLSHIYIPDGVEEIGKKAFAGCAKGFILQSSNPKWQAYALKEKLKFELIDDPYVK